MKTERTTFNLASGEMLPACPTCTAHAWGFPSGPDIAECRICHQVLVVESWEFAGRLVSSTTTAPSIEMMAYAVAMLEERIVNDTKSLDTLREKIRERETT